MIENSPPTPILFTGNFRQTSLFYKDALGFKVSIANGELLAERGDMSILFCRANGWTKPSDLGVILQTPDIRKLHEEYNKQQLKTLSQLRVVRRQPLSFSIRDIDGNHLRFVGFQPTLCLEVSGKSQIRRYGV